MEPPPLKASPYAVIFTSAAHPIYEGETGQLKRCTYIREAYFTFYQIVGPELIYRFDLICKITGRF